MSDDADLVEPDGDGAEWFDAPAVFYLTHREQIERWHALRHRADEAVNQYLLDLRNDLQSTAEEHGFRIEPFDTGRYYRCLLLWPEDAPLDTKGEPPIAAALRWPREGIAVDDQARAPRIGVRIGRGSDELCGAFLDCADPNTRQQHDYRAQAPRWPVFRDLPAEPQWWADLDGYRAQLVGAVTKVVEQFGQCIHDVHPDR